MLKEKNIGFFSKGFFFKEKLLVKVFTKPLQGLRGSGAEPHIGKKVVRQGFFSISLRSLLGLRLIFRAFILILPVFQNDGVVRVSLSSPFF